MVIKDSDVQEILGCLAGALRELADNDLSNSPIEANVRNAKEILESALSQED